VISRLTKMFNKNRIKKMLFILFSILFLLFLIFLLIPLPDTPLYPSRMVSCEILDREGRLLRLLLSDSWSTSCRVKLEEISPYLVDATLVSEDKRYYSHMGVDLLSLLRAVEQNIQAGRIVSGGSTITQQLAGIVYNLPQRSLFAKIFETIYALKLEMKYSKKELLEIYLNRIPYGNQTYGIEAASQLYFGKPSLQLSPAEAAFLSIIPRSPAAYDPYRNFDVTRKEELSMLERMYRAGKISETEYRQAIKEPLLIQPVQEKFLAPHFCNFILSELNSEEIKDPAQIRTTLDLDLQKEVEKIIKKTVSSFSEKNVTNGAALVVDNETGNIVAMVGSYDFFSEDGQVNACLAKRQPGSALKPFTYALALERGYRASDLIADLEMTLSTPDGIYIPRNYDNRFHGPVRFRQALGCSYNIPALKVTEKLGAEVLLKKLREAGFDSLDKDFNYYGAGLTLGSGEVTLFELVRAYRSLAAGGELMPLSSVLDVRDEKNNLITFFGEKNSERFFSPQAAFLITDILSDNNARMAAFGAGSPLNLPFPCAAKTGTSRDYRDNWTVGYTPRYTVGVWVGNFNSDPMEGVSGITGAGPAFRDIMTFLESKYIYSEDFTMPENIVCKSICPASGKLPGKHCPNTIREYYMSDNLPAGVCNVHRMVKMDRRSGHVASPECPPEYITEKVYEIYPPLYYDWMEKNGLMPPEDVLFALQNPEGDIIELSIITPQEGDIFKIDPVLRKEYQILYMKALVPEGLKEISWIIDGKEGGKTKSPFVYKWPLVAGSHNVMVRGDDRESKIIDFNVYDTEKK